LTEEVLLKQTTVAEMLVVDQAAQEAQEGLNLFVFSRYEDRGYGKMIGHVGVYAGYRSEMYYFPRQDTAFVMLTNSSGRGINQRWSELFEEVVTTINRHDAR
jgi:CubicO group peptidase (beta-lactamase class C family)